MQMSSKIQDTFATSHYSSISQVIMQFFEPVTIIFSALSTTFQCISKLKLSFNYS